MGSELQFCWLLNQQSAQPARPLCAPPRGGWGRCLWTPRTLPPSLLLCVLDSSGLPASINIHAHLQSQGASSHDKLHLDSSLAVEPEVCDDPGASHV